MWWIQTNQIEIENTEENIAYDKRMKMINGNEFWKKTEIGSTWSYQDQKVPKQLNRSMWLGLVIFFDLMSMLKVYFQFHQKREEDHRRVSPTILKEANVDDPWPIKHSMSKKKRSEIKRLALKTNDLINTVDTPWRVFLKKTSEISRSVCCFLLIEFDLKRVDWRQSKHKQLFHRHPSTFLPEKTFQRFFFFFSNNKSQ